MFSAASAFQRAACIAASLPLPRHCPSLPVAPAVAMQVQFPLWFSFLTPACHCCRFDHLFGMFKTKEGKARRLDLIFVPPEELGFGTLGWIGGKQFLRFMRAYADNETSMHLNSHRCASAGQHADACTLEWALAQAHPTTVFVTTAQPSQACIPL